MVGPIVQERGRRIQAETHSLAHRWALALVAISLTASTVAQAAYLDTVELGSQPIFRRASPIGELAYTPGRGLQLGETGLTIGGYSNVTLTRDEGREAEGELDDLSFFIVGDPLPRLHIFAELEYEDAFTIDEDGDFSSPDDVFTAERLYADIAVADAVNLRTGIFLTPVGRWNVMHAAPLVWTTSRPLTTENPHPVVIGDEAPAVQRVAA